jgi:hypothetical protein
MTSTLDRRSGVPSSRSSTEVAADMAALLERLLAAAGQSDRDSADEASRRRRLISFVERLDAEHRLRLEAALHLLGPKLDRRGSLQS